MTFDLFESCLIDTDIHVAFSNHFKITVNNNNNTFVVFVFFIKEVIVKETKK